MTLQADISNSLLALLRGEPGALAVLNTLPAEAVEDAAVREGLLPLVFERVERESVDAAGEGLGERLGHRARNEALRDVLRQRELREVLAAFAAASVEVLVFKGEQLAHLCYERPDLRPRVDTDLLVRPAGRTAAARVLGAAGYEKVPQLEAELISYQEMYVKRIADTEVVVIDLHWRVSNPQEFGEAIGVEELFDTAVPIAGLGPVANGPDVPHALLLSLVHPVAHHPGRERLLWDLDSSRLIGRMSPADWTRLVRVAGERELSGVLATRLDRTRRLFDATVPDEVRDGLARQSWGEKRRWTAGRRTRAGELGASLRALPRWADRTALLRQHLLPPREYMRSVYAPASRAPLAVLYIRRAILGTWKYLRHAQTS